MNNTAPRPSMTLGNHIAGASLLLLALSTLVTLTLLPTRGSAGIQLPFLDGLEPATAVAFAGFPGCNAICPTSLALMSDVYGDLGPDARKHVSLLFINTLRDTPPGFADQYAQAFHPDFVTYTIGAHEADTIYDALSLESYAEPQAAASHSGLIYVFTRQQNTWRIEQVFRRTPSSEQLLSALPGTTNDRNRMQIN